MTGEPLLRKNSYPLITRCSEIRSFKRRDLWLVVPTFSIFALWLISTLGVSATSASEIFKGFRLLVLLFAPGCYLAFILGKTIGLRLDETLAIDIMISMALATLVSVYLSFPLNQITDSAVYFGLLITNLLSGLLCLPRLLEGDGLREKVHYLNISKAGIGLLFSFFIGFLLVFRAIPTSYWRGWDPWVITPITRIILEKGLNPSELVETGLGNVGMSGFYYFLALVRAFTGIDCYTITRFGGPVLAGLASMITYLIVRRLEGIGSGFLASFFLFLNPFCVTRFSMALRENFTYIFFLVVLFLFVIGKQKLKKNYLFRFCYVFSICLFLAVTLITHSLTPLIINGIIFLELIFFLFKDRKDYALELLLSLLFSLLIAAPYLKIIISSYNWVIINQVPTSTIISILFILSSSLVVFLLYYKRLMRLDFLNKYKQAIFLIIAVTLLLGAFNSVVLPKTFPILGSYNPPIKIEQFATSILPLVILGFISTFWVSMSITVIFFSIIILLIMNFPNFNMAFPLFRLVIYISWLLSYGAIKFFKSIYDMLEESDLNISIHLKFLKSFNIIKLKVSLLICILMFTVISPMMIMDQKVISDREYYPNYQPGAVVSARDFVNLVKDNDIIVPQGLTKTLLSYVNVGLNKIIMKNETILNELYSVKSPQKFNQIIKSKYPTASRVYVFIINNFIGSPIALTPSFNLLNILGEKKQLEYIIYYNITLPSEYHRFEEIELLKYPINITLPEGSQWIHINITGIDLSKGWFLEFKIINNTAQKKAILTIKDMNEIISNMSEITLELGNGTYIVPFKDFGENIDLSKPSNLSICFSWYAKNPKIELTIKNITVVSKK